MKIVVSDAHGNEVTVEGGPDLPLDRAERAARRLFDHIAAEAPKTGPASGGQQIGFGLVRPGVAYFREGDHLEVKA